MVKRLIALFLVTALCLGAPAASASGGSAQDPLVSLSYITDTLLPSLIETAESLIEQQLMPVYNELIGRLPAGGGASSDYNYASGFSPLAFSSGGTVDMTAFTSFILTSGTARLQVTAGEVINLSRGTIVPSGSVLTVGERYFAAEETGARITVYSEHATGMVEGYYRCEDSGTLPSDVQFIDIETHWAREYILYLAERGIVNGVGNYRFSPEGVVNRAMFVTILGRLASVDTNQYTTSPFTDVAVDTWYGPYVAWAAENGIVNGYGNGRFGPTDSITREQMAVITMRFADHLGLVLPESETPVDFADADAISDYALESVQAAQRAGLINGRTATTFDPAGTAKRAEVCTIVYRLIERTGL